MIQNMIRKNGCSGSSNPEETKTGWFVYVLKNQVNAENQKHGREHLNNLKICLEKTSRFSDICFPRVSVWNESNTPEKGQCKSTPFNAMLNSFSDT